MQKNRIYESMTRIVHGGYTIRVWTRESEFQWRDKSGPRIEIVEAIESLPPSPTQIAHTLDTFEDVSAYEILDAEGNGAIVYPDWP